MAKLILMRHGQSVWNRANLFTGWVDVPLTSEGIEEALQAGRLIKGLPIDVIFTSTLVRAEMTAMLAMSEYGGEKTPVIIHDEESRLREWGQIYSKETEKNTIPVYKAWELNERMYGELQGLNKAETAKKYGDHQVHIWRRSYDVPPPAGEALKDTAARTIPFFENRILPVLWEGINVLVSAHGNSLRSILMDVDDLTEEQVLSLEIPTGQPMVYEVTFSEEQPIYERKDLSRQ